jgi:hypothetical protein
MTVAMISTRRAPPCSVTGGRPRAPVVPLQDCLEPSPGVVANGGWRSGRRRFKPPCARTSWPSPTWSARRWAPSVKAVVALIGALNLQIAQLDATLADRFEQHPDAKGHPLPARIRDDPRRPVLGEFGDDPNRYADAKSRKNYAGTSPINEGLGDVDGSSWPASPATAASSTRATCGHSPPSPPVPARAFYDQRRVGRGPGLGGLCRGRSPASTW